MAQSAANYLYIIIIIIIIIIITMIIMDTYLRLSSSEHKALAVEISK